MRLFEEKAGISSSYIHAIEKEDLLPSPEKLEALASVFVDVAREQEAAEPEADARRLFRERKLSVYIRMGFDPKMAEILLSLQELGTKQRADIMQPLTEAIHLFQTLESQERRAVRDLISKLVAFLESREGTERQEAAAFLSEAAEAAIAKEKEPASKGGGVQQKAATATPAISRR